MYRKRQSEIIKYLSDVKAAKIEQLAEIFQVSIETIRRDLMELEKDAVVKRVWGGVVYNNLRAREWAYEKRMEDSAKEKQAIAKLVSDYIKDGEAIAMNNGTANLELAKVLVMERESLTIVTNSPQIAVILNENESHRVFMTAGYLRKHNKSLVGSLCRESLDNFKVDKAILSIDGVSIEHGITEYNTEEAATIRKMMEIGHTKMLLCEYSKFNEVALNKICLAEEIDYIFTDWNITSKEIKIWGDMEVKELVAPNIYHEI